MQHLRGAQLEKQAQSAETTATAASRLQDGDRRASRGQKWARQNGCEWARCRAYAGGIVMKYVHQGGWVLQFVGDPSEILRKAELISWIGSQPAWCPTIL